MLTGENAQRKDGVYIHKVRPAEEALRSQDKISAPETVSRWIEEARGNREGSCRRSLIRIENKPRSAGKRDRGLEERGASQVCHYKRRENRKVDFKKNPVNTGRS